MEQSITVTTILEQNNNSNNLISGVQSKHLPLKNLVEQSKLCIVLVWQKNYSEKDLANFVT